MDDLRCDEVVELVSDFIDGDLDAATEARVVQHLSGCDGCQAYVAQFRQTVETLAELPADERAALTPATRAALLERFRGST
jgi:anti-sigma factor RsiW